MITPLAHSRRTAPVEAIAAHAATFVRGSKLPAAAGTPEALAADGTFVATVTIWGLKAARTANAGMVYVDGVATNDAQMGELAPGSYIQFTAPPGTLIDLGDLFVDIVSAGDGVFFLGMR